MRNWDRGLLANLHLLSLCKCCAWSPYRRNGYENNVRCNTENTVFYQSRFGSNCQCAGEPGLVLETWLIDQTLFSGTVFVLQSVRWLNGLTVFNQTSNRVSPLKTL